MCYCRVESYHLPEIFAWNNEKNENRFQRVHRAYLRGRYKGNYSISIAQLISITEKVKELQNVLKETIF